MYAIKSHDSRSEFKPKSKLDLALIIADSLAIIIEKIKRKPISEKDIELEIDRVTSQEPWLKENLLRCEEIGISKSELLMEVFQKHET